MTPATTQSTPVDEIIYPQGEFWSDEPPLESNLHLKQIILLIQCLERLWQGREDFFAAGNLTIYYSPEQKKNKNYRGPDFFVVLGTNPRQNRRSWVVWEEEGKYPHVIIEILSVSTAKVDKEDKKQIYQDTFRTPNYFWFDPESLELAGFNLVSGKYQPLEANEKGWLWSDQLGLYLGVEAEKLRYFTASGELVPTAEEAEVSIKQQKEYECQQKELALEQQEQERQQKEYECQQKELALQKIDQLTAKLRQLGIEP